MLCGDLPFSGATSEEIIAKIEKGQYNYNRINII